MTAPSPPFVPGAVYDHGFWYSPTCGQDPTDICPPLQTHPGWGTNPASDPATAYTGMTTTTLVILIATLTLILITAAITGYRLIARNTRGRRRRGLHPAEEENIRKARRDHP